MTNFSVLISVYIKTKLWQFEECLNSIDNQSLLPSEIIIVKDGILNFDLNEIVYKYPKLNIVIVINENNLGLPKSLNKGIDKCSNEIIFRMDSDDICLEDRFYLQLQKFISNDKLAVLGTNVCLIDDNSVEIAKSRNVPVFDADIRKTMRYKNPFNHPSVVFRKSLVQSVGGYTDVYLYEDWYLWFKLTRLKDVEFENMAERLLKYRIRSFSERSGFNIVKAENTFYFLLFKNKYINFFVLLINVFFKSIIRVMPKNVYNSFKHYFDKIG
ncbi:glycosyltransferase [Flavobacterium pectinovorum]|uniref:glycosyltransferase n=1 Tax=Flavobacterium pectinovorum TaxID=29533 RepID=UPI001FAB64D1|nr:glycosyltransferase [Flavobacterium pectinovorum]MCI9843868.1 glycosyltransferase [Flavobacterium pectinovorum]